MLNRGPGSQIEMGNQDKMESRICSGSYLGPVGTPFLRTDSICSFSFQIELGNKVNLGLILYTNCVKLPSIPRRPAKK